MQFGRLTNDSGNVFQDDLPEPTVKVTLITCNWCLSDGSQMILASILVDKLPQINLNKSYKSGIHLRCFTSDSRMPLGGHTTRDCSKRNLNKFKIHRRCVTNDSMGWRYEYLPSWTCVEVWQAMCFTAIDRWKPCVFNVLIQTAAMTFDTVERQGGEIQERETERGKTDQRR